MAKRKAKAKTAAEQAEIEADRIAAHGTGENTVVFEQEVPLELTHDEAVQGANLASGIPDDHSDSAGHNDDEPVEDGDPVEEPAGEERVPNSIVKAKFKDKYIENAKAQGLTSKAAKRSNWDWLSQQLATFCLSDKGKIDIGSFTDVLDANGIDHSKWTNKNKGWEGRFRMTGRVALQKVVANTGFLKWPGELQASEAPDEWRARFKTKS
jgi:hypothetical protein